MTSFLDMVDENKRKFNSHTWLIKCGGLRTFLSCHLDVTEEEHRRLARASEVTSNSLLPAKIRRRYTCGEDFFESLNEYMGKNTSLEYVPTEGDTETGPMFVFRHKNTEIQHRSFMTSVFRDDIFARCMERINVFGVHLCNDSPDKNIDLISKALIHMGGDDHKEEAAILKEAMYLRSPDQIARDVLDRMVDRQPKPPMCQVCGAHPKLEDKPWCRQCGEEDDTTPPSTSFKRKRVVEAAPLTIRVQKRRHGIN